LQNWWYIAAIVLKRSRSPSFTDEIQFLLQPNPLLPVSILFDVSIHTKSNNDIYNNAPVEEGVREKHETRNWSVKK